MKIDLSEMGRKIRAIRGRLSLEEFEPIAGISKSMLSLYERGEAWPKPDVLSKIAEFGKISFDELLTGKEPGPGPEPTTVPDESIKEPSFPADTAKVNVYSMAGAGMPHTLTDYEPIETITLPARFIRPNIVPIRIRGRSMEPMIFNGAYVGVDKEDRQLVSGEVYAVWLPYEGAVVKRLYMAADRIIVKSDNPSFPELSIPINQVDENFIIGRVKWVLQEIEREG